MKVNKYHLQSKISRATGVPSYTVGHVITELAEAIKSEVVKGNTVNIMDFGKFEAQQRAARTGRNPHLNIPVNIPPCMSVKFLPAKAFKDALNEMMPTKKS